MNSLLNTIIQNGEEPYNAPSVDVGGYESNENYPYASSNNNGNYPSVQSYTSYSVINQRGVAPFHTDFVRNRNSGNGGSIEMDRSLHLLQLKSTREDHETSGVGYSSTFPRYTF